MLKAYYTASTVLDPSAQSVSLCLKTQESFKCPLSVCFYSRQMPVNSPSKSSLYSKPSFQSPSLSHSRVLSCYNEHQPDFLYINGFFFFLAVLGLCCYTWAFSSDGEGRLLPSCSVWVSQCAGSSCSEHGLQSVQAQQLQHTGSAAPCHKGSSQTRDQTHVPCIGRQIPNRWTTREVFNRLFTSKHHPVLCCLSSALAHPGLQLLSQSEWQEVLTRPPHSHFPPIAMALL